MLCYFSTKSSLIKPYELVITPQHLLVVNPASLKVKCKLETQNVHVRKLPKVPRKSPVATKSKGTGKKGPTAAQVDEQRNRNERNIDSWFPVKLVLASKKFRILFTESKELREQVISSVLKAQGFSSPIDQYAFNDTLYIGAETIIWSAQHKLTGALVAIKSIELSKAYLYFVMKFNKLKYT